MLPEDPLDVPIEVTHSVVQGGYPGTGNLDADPLFAGNPLESGSSWTSVELDSLAHWTVFVDDTAGWSPGALTGLLVMIDLGDDALWASIESNSATPP